MGVGNDYNFFVDGHLFSSAQRKMLQDSSAVKHRSVTPSCIPLEGKKGTVTFPCSLAA